MFDVTLLHPKVVHFTIALFSVAVQFDLIGMIFKKEYFHNAAWLNLIFASAAGIVTVLTGLLAEANVVHNDAAHGIMETHETIGFFVLGAILILLIWRLVLKGKFPYKTSYIYMIIAAAGVGLMFTGAYYGGEMVYTHGVAVKAMSVNKSEAEHPHNHGNSEHEQIKPEDKHHEAENREQIPHSPEQSINRSQEDTIKKENNMHQHKDGSNHLH
jgi:uncharacterized membrane protein